MEIGIRISKSYDITKKKEKSGKVVKRSSQKTFAGYGESDIKNEIGKCKSSRERN